MPEPAPNAFGVNVRPLDETDVHSPLTKSYHGASIVTGNKVIGRIQSFQPSGAYTREGVHIYELSHTTWGRPVDYVPGRQTGYTIAITRVEVWEDELELAMGFDAVFDDLADQDRPFTIYEYLFRGKSLYRVWEYSGCWFQDRNEDAQTADGDGVFRVNATLAYVKRRRIF